MALTPLKKFPNCGVLAATPVAGWPNPFTIAPSGSWQSDLLPSAFGGCAAACTSTQTGVLTLLAWRHVA